MKQAESPNDVQVGAHDIYQRLHTLLLTYKTLQETLYKTQDKINQFWSGSLSIYQPGYLRRDLFVRDGFKSLSDICARFAPEDIQDHFDSGYAPKYAPEPL